MRVTHDSILHTDNLVALECHICVDFAHGGKPEYSEKNLSNHSRDQLWELSHVKRQQIFDGLKNAQVAAVDNLQKTCHQQAVASHADAS